MPAFVFPSFAREQRESIQTNELGPRTTQRRLALKRSLAALNLFPRGTNKIPGYMLFVLREKVHPWPASVHPGGPSSSALGTEAALAR